MTTAQPEWLAPERWLSITDSATSAQVLAALGASEPGQREFATLLSKAAGRMLEELAARAKMLTTRHFGRTISLYVPLYLSNHCSGGCAYCGFASDRKLPRIRLSRNQLAAELRALRIMGYQDVLLLTGERSDDVGVEYVRESVAAAAKLFHSVSVETFAMTTDEYAALMAVGCVGVTLYQETYNESLYKELHRWGEKRDRANRLQAPDRALDAGMRTFGIGALLGLDNPIREAVSVFQHGEYLRKKFWRSGISISFPRVREQAGGYEPPRPVSDRLLAQIVFAFRICLPDVPLVLSTRETPAFRDGMAGVGISRMSVGSKTTVGGYADAEPSGDGQFEVSDERGVDAFSAMLKERQLSPVFKNWDSVFTGNPRQVVPPLRHS